MESKKEFIVGQQDTAAVLGSGGLDVLATPRLVAMVENTCWEASTSSSGNLSVHEKSQRKTKLICVPMATMC